MGKRRRKGPNRIRPGDGSPQPELRRRDVLVRTLMLAEVEEDGTPVEYGAFVDFFSDDEDARLYRNGVQVATAELPARFPIPDGEIEISTSIFGLKRARVVRDDGTAATMRPARGSAEYWRARFGLRFPGWSRAIGVAAVVVLLLGLVVAVPAALELLTSWDLIGDRVGRFESPISLPGWVNWTLFGAGLVAALERALTLRNHWLVDADTWVLGP